MPRVNADQAETVLARAREAGLRDDHPLVVAGLDRLEATGGKRRRNAAARWFGAAGDEAEARQQRAEAGTTKQQKQAYREYVEQIANELEERGRGGGGVTRQTSNRAARGEKGADNLERILTSNADTIRARLSSESLERLAELGGPPLSFDAWRFEYLGARDRRAVESHQRRTGGYFSEYG